MLANSRAFFQEIVLVQDHGFFLQGRLTSRRYIEPLFIGTNCAVHAVYYRAGVSEIPFIRIDQNVNLS